MNAIKHIILMILTAFSAPVLIYFVYIKDTPTLYSISLMIFIFIVFSFLFLTNFKRYKNVKAGITINNDNDELSMLLKYKAGYYALLFSLTLWGILFIFKNYFSNFEMIILIGFFLPAICAITLEFAMKYIHKRKSN